MHVEITTKMFTRCQRGKMFGRFFSRKMVDLAAGCALGLGNKETTSSDTAKKQLSFSSIVTYPPGEKKEFGRLKSSTF